MQLKLFLESMVWRKIYFIVVTIGVTLLLPSLPLLICFSFFRLYEEQVLPMETAFVNITLSIIDNEIVYEGESVHRKWVKIRLQDLTQTDNKREFK